MLGRLGSVVRCKGLARFPSAIVTTQGRRSTMATTTAATTTKAQGDPFGRQAKEYAAFRPNYPDALVEAVRGQLRAKGLVSSSSSSSTSGGDGGQQQQPATLLVDICTGSGQVLRKLAADFTAAKGFDRSVPQLSQATALPNVDYGEADACAIPLPDRSAAVVTVAQAMHWLDIPPFMREVERLLAPGGVGIVLGYPRTRIPALPAADAALMEWYATLDDYWDCDRKLLDREFDGTDYAPLVQVGKDRVVEVHPMDPPRLGAYLRTWSSFNTWKQRHPEVKPDTVDVLEGELAEVLVAEGRQTLPVEFVFFAIYLQRPADARSEA